MSVRLLDVEASRVVLIGAASYSSSALHDLPAVANNLSDLAELFTSPTTCGISPDDCIVISEPQLPDVGLQLERVAAAAKDTLVVYYSGHGVPSDHGKLYLSLPGTDPEYPQWTALDFELVRGSIANSPARNRVLILDCCFSGRAIASMADSSAIVSAETEIYGTYTMTSASANVAAVAPVGARNTAFTAALLAAARAGTDDGAEALSLDALYRRVLADQSARAYPRPRQRGTDMVQQLALFRNAAARGRDATPPTSPDLAFDSEIDELRHFERDVRTRLRSYFLGMRERLEVVPPTHELQEFAREYTSRLLAFFDDRHEQLLRSKPPSDLDSDGDLSTTRVKSNEDLVFLREYHGRLMSYVADMRASVSTLARGCERSADDADGLRSALTSHVHSELIALDTGRRPS